MTDSPSPEPPQTPGITPQGLPPIGPVVARFARVLWYLVETVATGVAWQQFESGSPFEPAGAGADGTGAQTWRRVSVKWDNVSTAEQADNQYHTLDVVNLTGGEVDPTWTDADYTQLTNGIQSIVQALAPIVSGNFRAVEANVYVMAFNPYGYTPDQGKTFPPFAPTGAPERRIPLSTLGTASSAHFPQACTTITEETPDRRHWGRFYSPSLGTNVVGTNGRLNTSSIDALATAMDAAYGYLFDQQLVPVVPTTQVNKQPARTLQAVTGIRVDDVTDVIRSRRLKYALYHKITQTSSASTKPGPEETP